MQHAKKLVLVEPRLLQELQLNNEYKDLQRLPDVKTQSIASLGARNMLNQNDDSLPDDLKAKIYQQAFSHFLNLTNEITPPTKAKINPLTRPQPPVPQQDQAAAADPSPLQRRQRKIPRRYSPPQAQKQKSSPKQQQQHPQRDKRKRDSPTNWVAY